MTEDHSGDHPQVQCVRGQNRRKPGLRTAVEVGLPCPSQVPAPILSWRRPVCDKKKAGGHRHLPGTSVVQWALSSVCLVQCVPSFCPRSPPGDSWKKSGRIPTTGPAGWVELGRWKEEAEGSVYLVTEASAPRAGPAHLQRQCLLGMGKSGDGGVRCHRLLWFLRVQLPLDGSHWERAAGS